MKNYWLIGLRISLVTLILFGVLYPLMITGIAKVIAPDWGRGRRVVVNDAVVGFELIGQKFDDDKYFNGRPSAVDYNAASTGGSNKGPTNPEYLAQVQARIDTFLIHNPDITKAQIPVDLITASGGGLDPHISVESAEVQIPRVAKTRNIDVRIIEQLVRRQKESAALGIGPSRVHVLRLNIALDQLK